MLVEIVIFTNLHGQNGQGKAENSMLWITLMWIPKLALAAQTLSKADKDSEGRKKITLEARSPFFNLLRFSMATWSGKLVLLAAVYTVG